ncbi:MORN repeat-containing protein [Nonlabens xiamenensis]|uniref:MORN repeat-containing protein n=1 Tax=Nonlabens xiamenensis TaxID=2341043 RepID=UPI000F60EB20|nr:hypothetical protein [Nonlabens xiamenensis]
MKRSLYYIILALVILLGSYFAYQYFSLEEETVQLRQSLSEQSNTYDRDRYTSTLDSLLEIGEFEQVLSTYDSLPSDLAMDLELRRQLAQKFSVMERRLYILDTASTPRDTLRVPVDRMIETPEIQAYDSLSFALEKAQMQLQSIKKQMMEKAFGEYITFKSTKGNRLHYVGEVKNKKANGLGIAILDSGSRYEGEWKDNMRHGQGTFYWIDGQHYEGQYVNDKRSGQGTYYWTNGEKYVGSWENDKRNGRGVFYASDGSVVTSGIWENDELTIEDAE